MLKVTSVGPCTYQVTKRAFESGLSLIYIGIHDVSKFNWLPLTLNACMSFPGMMQGDNENIKVNLVFALCL